MAKYSSVSKSLHLLLFTVFLLSVGMGVEAKTCSEELQGIKVVCQGSKADGPCWEACQNKHGVSATASCIYPPQLTTPTCWCTWDC